MCGFSGSGTSRHAVARQVGCEQPHPHSDPISDQMHKIKAVSDPTSMKGYEGGRELGGSRSATSADSRLMRLSWNLGGGKGVGVCVSQHSGAQKLTQSAPPPLPSVPAVDRLPGGSSTQQRTLTCSVPSSQPSAPEAQRLPGGSGRVEVGAAWVLFV